MTAEPMRLLLIEDNPGDARLIRERLRDLSGRNASGYALQSAPHLAGGLALLEQEPFDLILLDLSLPDSSGTDTILTARQKAPDTPILVLTGTEDIELGLKAIQLGAQEYLPKGEAQSGLLEKAMRYAVERFRADRELRRSWEEYRSLIDDVFDTSTVGVIIVDPQHRIAWTNEAVHVYFGLTPAELIGVDKRTLISTVLKHKFTDPHTYEDRLLDAIEHGRFDDRFECHVRPAPGIEERWLFHWSQPIRSGLYAGGRIVQYTDITNRKKLEFAEREQRHFAEALRDIATILSSTLDLNEVLEKIFQNLDRIVPHESAVITILDGNQRWAARKRAGGGQERLEIIDTTHLQVDFDLLIESMSASPEPIIIGNLRDDGRMANLVARTDLNAYIGVPIHFQGEKIGYFNLLSRHAGAFSPRDGRKLSAFAEQAGIAIQNARLFQQSQQLAMLEERQRLARDLHDSVSQTLFTCRTLTESALRRWERDPAGTRELLDEVHHLTGLALNEMRVLLLELRPAHLNEIELKALFEQYLKPIQERRGFALELALDEIGDLPPAVKISLYRIAQEILNNIDKHAQAHSVRIEVGERDDRVSLVVCDDGQGFNPDQVPRGTFGLGNMRERAEQIGGTFHLTSAPGQGTRIEVTWPRRAGG